MEATAESRAGSPMKKMQGSEVPEVEKSVPYPERLKKTEPDVSKFIEIFKKL